MVAGDVYAVNAVFPITPLGDILYKYVCVPTAHRILPGDYLPASIGVDSYLAASCDPGNDVVRWIEAPFSSCRASPVESFGVRGLSKLYIGILEATGRNFAWVFWDVAGIGGLQSPRALRGETAPLVPGAVLTHGVIACGEDFLPDRLPVLENEHGVHPRRRRTPF